MAAGRRTREEPSRSRAAWIRPEILLLGAVTPLASLTGCVGVAGTTPTSFGALGLVERRSVGSSSVIGDTMATIPAPPASPPSFVERELIAAGLEPSKPSGLGNDPGLAQASSEPKPIGSNVPDAGPTSDIMTPAVPTSAKEYPIDLPTALRLADRDNPVIAGARARIGEALGRQQQARVELLPMLNAGANYVGHAGNLQQSKGTILDVYRQSVYVGGGAGAVGPMPPQVPAVSIVEPLADALYDPLVAHQRVHQAQFDAVATANTVLLEVATYYLDVLAATARLEAQRRSVHEAAELLRVTQQYSRVGEGRPYDTDRARTEWRIRRAEVRRAEEEQSIASARLCRRLHLDPSIRIRPAGVELEILALVDLNVPLPGLIETALEHRPEVRAADADIAATEFRRKQAIARPWLPTLFLGYSAGAFGGGSNLNPPLVGHFGARSDFDVAAYWTFENFGLGNLADQRRRRAQVGEAAGQQRRAVNLVREQVAAALGDALAQREQVEIDRSELTTAKEGFRRDFEQMMEAVTSREVRAPRPIEVLNSLTLLARARNNLIRSITAYDQSQFRLFVALGAPPPMDQPTDPDSSPVSIASLAEPVIAESVVQGPRAQPPDVSRPAAGSLPGRP